MYFCSTRVKYCFLLTHNRDPKNVYNNITHQLPHYITQKKPRGCSQRFYHPQSIRSPSSSYTFSTRNIKQQGKWQGCVRVFSIAMYIWLPKQIYIFTNTKIWNILMIQKSLSLWLSPMGLSSTLFAFIASNITFITHLNGLPEKAKHAYTIKALLMLCRLFYLIHWMYPPTYQMYVVRLFQDRRMYADNAFSLSFRNKKQMPVIYILLPYPCLCM